MAVRRKKESQNLSLIKKSLKTRIAELTALYAVSNSITSSIRLDKVLKLIVKKVVAILKADICLIHLLNKGDIIVKTLYGVRSDMAELRLPLPLSSSVISKAISSKKPERLADLLKCKNDVFCKIVKKRSIRSMMIVPLVKNGKAIGALTCCSRNANAYRRDDERELSLFASQAAVAIENARLFEEIRDNYFNTMKLLASVIDAKDEYTENHSESVMRVALCIANALKLPGQTKFVIKYASLLHDIGKIGIDISILRKPGPLTKEEWCQMKEHPRTGADIIKKAGFLDELIPAILYHHVRYSGGGYPATKKKGNSIPIEARILAIADAYEAMTSDRPYRRRISKEQAIVELRKCSGTQFDPKIIKAFLKCLCK